MSNELGLRFNIGDRIHANCYTDHDFVVDVEIVGIGTFDLAERYEDILLTKMFNSSNSKEVYREFLENNTYYYICCVQYVTESFNEGDMIILTDSLIKDQGTYFLNQDLSIYINLSFSSITNYRTKQDVINGIKLYLETNGVKDAEIYEELSYQEKLDYELNEYRSIINSLKSLKSLDQLVDRLNSCFNSLTTKVNLLIEKITNILNK